MLNHYREGTYSYADQEEKNRSADSAKILRYVHAIHGERFGPQTTYHLFRELATYTPQPQEKEEQSQEQTVSLFDEKEEKLEINEIELKGQETYPPIEQERLQDQKKNPPRNICSLGQECEDPEEKLQNPPSVISLFSLSQNLIDEKPKDQKHNALQKHRFFTQDNSKSREGSIQNESKKKQKEPENSNRFISVFVSYSSIFMEMDDEIRSITCRSTDLIHRVKQQISGRRDNQSLDDIVLILNEIPITKEFDSFTIKEIEEMRGFKQQISRAVWFVKGPPSLIPNGIFLRERVIHGSGLFFTQASDDTIDRYQPSGRRKIMSRL